MKTTSKLFTLILVGALALVGGCYTANVQLPGTLRNDIEPAQTESAGRVELEKTNYFFLFGLVNQPQPDFLAVDLRQQVKARGGDGVRNLQYESQFGCLDLIISGLTFNCVTPRTYKVTGEIVKIKSG